MTEYDLKMLVNIVKNSTLYEPHERERLIRELEKELAWNGR